jgi:hyaluronoglucosaminidase
MDCGCGGVTPELGIIEGYFGRCWTHDERCDVISRLAPAGYRFFHYAPKIDARLRRDWRQLHDGSETDVLTALSDHCRSLDVRFGVGLTPYGAHLDFDADTRAALKAKLAALDALGVDDLAILFDDMRGDVPDLAARQAEIIAFCLDHSRAGRFYTCPSYYSDDPVLDRVFGARPDCYLEDFGRLIDPAIQIYWTGEEVCSVEYSRGHLRNVAQRLGRNVCLWDNYPVNDGPRMSQYLHLRGFTGRGPDIAPWITGHAINPALQPTLGCIPALTLTAAYAQGDDYCYGVAFMEAAVAVVGTELAVMLQTDLLTFQSSGLDRIGERTEKLRLRYAAIDHPAAREVVDWLGGGYAITGEMLQTQ